MGASKTARDLWLLDTQPVGMLFGYRTPTLARYYGRRAPCDVRFGSYSDHLPGGRMSGFVSSGTCLPPACHVPGELRCRLGEGRRAAVRAQRRPTPGLREPRDAVLAGPWAPNRRRLEREETRADPPYTSIVTGRSMKPLKAPRSSAPSASSTTR